MHSISVEQHYSLTPIAKAAEWHSQRNVSNPNSEAETGVHLKDNDNDDDDQSVDGFMKICFPPEGEEHDEISKHLYKCGIHLCKAKVAHMSGDHEQVGRAINSAMASYSKLHAGLKAATQD